MSVGLLLVSHVGLARAFLDNARAAWPVDLPTEIGVLEVPRDCDLQHLGAIADASILRLDQGDGVLVLVDICGATPANLIRDRLRPGLMMVCGLNFPMLMRTLTNAERPLMELAELAVQGAVRGIVAYPEEA